MSNLVFPTLPGLAWNVARSPQWATRIQKAVSGKEFRSAWMSAPLYTFRLQYEVLREASAYQELQQLVAFYNNVRGSFDSFLYRDPNDNSVTAHSFGTGNGVQTAFQLVRSYGGNLEAVGQLNGAPSIYINGVLQATGYTISATGLVTFSVAPINAAALTWTGNYYYRCRFLQDAMELNEFMNSLWEAKKVEFIGSLTPNRI